MTQKDIGIVILAAGKGSRMNQNQAKVLTKLKDTFLIKKLLNTINKTEYRDAISIVVGYQGEKVIEALNINYNFIWQFEQLGTGHAVRECKSSLKNRYNNYLILYGDMPFISAETINKIISLHQKSNSILTMITLKLPDFREKRKMYYHFGRIIRDADSKIVKIVEFKDANEEERKITELNPAIYCIKDEWLWKNLDKIKNNNKQKEYYLTDLVALAHQENSKISSLVIENDFEFMGINTPDDLELAESTLITRTSFK